MIIERSKQMMKKSFEETVYHFAEAPPADLDGDFGVYVHVPFCLTMCSFCPFYKELYDEDLKAQYLDAMIAEIRGTRMAGRAKWIYFGGGTPNLLTLDELARVVGAICERVDVASIGIELLPARSTAEYLAGLRQIGFTKVSIGVESLSQEVMAPTGRKLSRREHIADLIAAAKALGLWINVDLMVGLPHQAPAAFRADVEQAA
ncbi:MAG: radical SAM protein, partial [Chloroflexi bacterium]|nr:radical SAM protein [Chloroflexota bacterium]